MQIAAPFSSRTSLRAILGIATVLTVAGGLRPADAATARPESLLTARADTLLARKDWARAAKAYRELTGINPGSFRHWYRLGFSLASAGELDPAIEAYRCADALGVAPQFARFGLACAFGKKGEIDSAFVTLERLLDAGFRQANQLQNDPDLQGLHSDPRFAAVLDRAKRNAAPCLYVPESRQLDFWVGDWEVRDNRRDQGVVGSSHIERILGDCVIFENWTGRWGSGKSLNGWNADLGCWQQSWMDDSGEVTQYTDGHYADGAMVFHAESPTKDGKTVRQKLTFFNLGPDRVRQLGEKSTDGGRTWSVAYDLTYVRRKPASPQ